MTQFSFVFNPAANGAEAWQVELEALRDAVSLLTVKELAHQLDLDRSAIDDALAERDNKRWASRWTHVVRAMLMHRADKAALDILERIIDAQAIGTPFIVDQVDYSDAEVEAAKRVVATAERRKDRLSKRDRKRAA